MSKKCRQASSLFKKEPLLLSILEVQSILANPCSTQCKFKCIEQQTVAGFHYYLNKICPTYSNSFFFFVYPLVSTMGFKQGRVWIVKNTRNTALMYREYQSWEGGMKRIEEPLYSYSSWYLYKMVAQTMLRTYEVKQVMLISEK